MMCAESSSTLCSSDNSVWFLLIWFKLAQKKKKKKAPATHPLIGNGRSSLNIGVSAIAGVKLGSHRRTVFREEREKKKMNLQHCLWTLCLWILFKSFFFLFLFKAVLLPGSCGALISCVFDSQISGSERCEPQRDQICLPRARKRDDCSATCLRRRSARTSKCFSADLNVLTWESLFAVFRA